MRTLALVGPDEDMWHDEDIAAIAYHEAGHATAAILCVVGWEEVRLIESDAEALEDGAVAWTTYVAEHHADTTPANRAFIAWAGSWAEARYHSPDDPWDALLAAQDEGGQGDMERVDEYWNDPAHAPHETDEEWAHSLDGAWKHVEALAERIYRERVVRPPLYRPDEELWLDPGVHLGSLDPEFEPGDDESYP